MAAGRGSGRGRVITGRGSGRGRSIVRALRVRRLLLLDHVLVARQLLVRGNVVYIVVLVGHGVVKDCGGVVYCL